MLGLTLLLLPFLFSCSDEIAEGSDSDNLEESEYVLNFSLGMDQNEADVRAVPGKTGEVGDKFEFSQTYDKPVIYLRQDESQPISPLPFTVTGSRITMTITLNGDKLTIANEKNESRTLSSSKNNTDFYFASHPGDVVNTTEQIEGKDCQRPIGDDVFRSNPFKFNKKNGILHFNGQSLKDLKIPEIKMNRSTCVLMPIVMITNVKNTNAKHNLTEFPAELGQVSSWKMGAVIPGFPTSYSLDKRGTKKGKFVGEAIASPLSHLLIMQNKPLEATTFTMTYKEQKKEITETYTGFAAVGPKDQFIYGTKITKVYLPIYYNSTRHTLKVNVANKALLSHNTHHRVFFIIDWLDLKGKFFPEEGGKTKALENVDDELIDIPCEVIVD